MKAARFTVLGPLMGGHGSQAFLGQEVGPKGPIRPVVMVFLPDEVVEDKDIFDRILDETKVAVRIDHPNVISVHGLAKLDEGYARIVEFVDGESVRSIFRRLSNLGRRMPPSIATAVVANACMGVHYAHELGLSEAGKPLLHGGIRPETLLISFHGATKVTGYGASIIAEGMARARGMESSIRDSYTAPEQIFGGRKAATLRTDVYGLGAVLYEALSGKPPFGQDASLAEAITSQKPSESLLSDVPAGMAEIVLQAMAKQSEERFETAMEMRDALLALGNPSSDEVVAAFMEELCPADSPQRLARNALIEQGRGSGPALTPTGIPVVSEPTGPEQAGVPPGLSSQSGEHVLPTPPAANPTFETATTGEQAAQVAQQQATPTPAPQQTAPQAAPQTAQPSFAQVPTSETAAPSAQLQVPPSMPAPSGAVVAPMQAPQQPPASQPSLPPLRQAPPSTMMPGQPVANPFVAPYTVVTQEHVVYKTHPALYIGLGLFGGVALVLLAVFMLRSPATPEPAPVAPAPVQPVATPAPPVTPPDAGKPKVVEAAPPKKVAKPRRSKKPRRGKRGSRRPPAESSGDDGETIITDTGSSGSGKGVLIIDAPNGSEVFIDGKRKGKAPLDPLELKAGRHKVLVKQPSTGVQYRRSVLVKEDLDLTMTVYFHND